MSDPGESERDESVAARSASVLGNLPRTRPQRASARRTAARGARNGAGPSTGASARNGAAGTGAGATAEKPRAQRKAKAAAGAGARKRRAAARPASASATGSRAKPKAAQPVPRQGFECEGDTGRGAVQPPGGAELVASAVEIVGEFAKSGASAGERLLKDVFSRITPS